MALVYDCPPGVQISSASGCGDADKMSSNNMYTMKNTIFSFKRQQPIPKQQRKNSSGCFEVATASWTTLYCKHQQDIQQILLDRKVN